MDNAIITKVKYTQNEELNMSYEEWETRLHLIEALDLYFAINNWEQRELNLHGYDITEELPDEYYLRLGKFVSEVQAARYKQYLDNEFGE